MHLIMDTNYCIIDLCDYMDVFLMAASIFFYKWIWNLIVQDMQWWNWYFGGRFQQTPNLIMSSLRQNET